MSIVLADLPNSGLGNKLLVWARALVFSRRHSLPLVVRGWTQLQLGPLIRGGDLRLYWNYFIPCQEAPAAEIRRLQNAKRVIEEPEVRAEGEALYRFAALPNWRDFFADIRSERSMVAAALEASLTPARRREIASARPPVVALHIRRGDFRELVPGEQFHATGNVRTPLSYFVAMVNGIRWHAGSNLPVTIFSDGTPGEFEPLLRLGNVQLARRGRTPIADLFLLANSALLVCSAASSFSDWAVFLGNQPAIRHRDHIHSLIRGTNMARRVFEGGVPDNPDAWPALLVDNIQKIRSGG